MKLHINDANILIDIVELDIVDAFLALKFELHTTNFVFAELNDEQKIKLDRKELNRIIPTTEDLQKIFDYANLYNGLSIEDCSVLFFAEKLEGYLVSGDGKLRKIAKSKSIEVKGIIYIIEQIKDQYILDSDTCIELLLKLKKINERLPLNEIDNRIKAWRIE